MEEIKTIKEKTIELIDQNHITDVLANAFNSNDKKATPIQQLSVEYNFESCEGIETCQLVTVIAEFSAIYGNKNKNIDKSYGSPGGYDILYHRRYK